MPDFISIVANALGIPPAYMPLILMAIVAACNLIGKLIPDSATGGLALIRKICRVIGLYVTNRITPNLSASDVNKAIAATLPDSVLKHAANELPNAVATGEATTSVATALVNVAENDSQERIG